MRRKKPKEKAKKVCKFEINKIMAKKVKRLFGTQLKCTSLYEYALLKDIVVELSKSNPCRTMILSIYPTVHGVTHRFKRLYICFDAYKMGFKKGCRRIIGINGCFLRRLTKCQMLTAIRRDANDQMYVISWAIVEVENKKEWMWFLSLLRDDLEIDDNHKWVIQSDQQKVIVVT